MFEELQVLRLLRNLLLFMVRANLKQNNLIFALIVPTQKFNFLPLVDKPKRLV